MRKLTKEVGQMLYRDGPMIVASALFLGLFGMNISDITS